MKKTLTRITGITVLGVAVAAGLAYAQTDGAGPAGPGGRSDDTLNQPVPPNTTSPATPPTPTSPSPTPDASDRNALPAITSTPPGASAPDASTGTNTGTGGMSPDQGSPTNGSAATQPDGSAVSPAEQTRTLRSPRADRN